MQQPVQNIFIRMVQTWAYLPPTCGCLKKSLELFWELPVCANVLTTIRDANHHLKLIPSKDCAKNILISSIACGSLIPFFLRNWVLILLVTITILFTTLICIYYSASYFDLLTACITNFTTHFHSKSLTLCKAKLLNQTDIGGKEHEAIGWLSIFNLTSRSMVETEVFHNCLVE